MCVVTFDWKDNDAQVKVKNFMAKGLISWYVIELTHRCNFNCVWCYAGSGENKADFNDMKFEDLENILNILALSGVKQVTFSGGEPTVYPRLLDAVKAAHKRGLVVHLNSNAYLLSKDYLMKLKEAGLSQVQINIDSLDSQIHDEIRGKPGSFEKALNALRISSELGITAVSQTVVTKMNEHEIIDIMKKVRKAGVQRCRVWDMVLSGTALENTDLMPTDFVETLKNVVEFARENGAIHVESGDPMFPLNMDYGIKISGGICAAIKGGFATIAPNGDVFPCATVRESMYNIFDVIKDGEDLTVKHKEAIAKYRKELGIPDECINCKHIEDCSGGCPTRRKARNGSKDYWCKL